MLWLGQYKIYILSFICSFSIHYGVMNIEGMSKLSEPCVKFSQGTSVLKLTMMPAVDSIRSVAKQKVIKKEAVDKKQEPKKPVKSVDPKQDVDLNQKTEITHKIDIKTEITNEEQQQNNDGKSSEQIDLSDSPSEKEDQTEQESKKETEASVQMDADTRTKGVVCESRVSSKPMPRYPRSSRRRGEEGIVSIKVWIDVKGNPKKVEIIKSSGFPSLDKSAVDALRKGSFVPAMKNSKPVASTLIQNIEFRLDQ